MKVSKKFDPDECPDNTKHIVFTQGSWYEIGWQYAKQAEVAVQVKLAAGIRTAINHFGSKQEASEGMKPYLDATILKGMDFIEIWNGIADAMGIERTDVYMAYLDYNEADERCSNVSVHNTSVKDGRTLCAVNCDEPEIVNFYAPAVVVYPNGGIPFISASALICNCFLNAEGLVAMGSCGQWNDLEHDCAPGMPNASALFLTISRCKTAKEAVEMTLQNGWGPSSGENMHFADKFGNAYVIEHTASKNVVRTIGNYGEKDYLIATNHFISPEMQNSVFRGTRKWDNPMVRYWTEERYLIENYGDIDEDILDRAMRNHKFYIRDDWKYTSWETDVEGYKTGWNNNSWKENPVLADQTAKWSPEIHTVLGKNVFGCIVDPNGGIMYVNNGSGNPLFSPNPYATGNYCRITLRDTIEQSVEDACLYAKEQIYFGERDIDMNDRSDQTRIEQLNKAKEALFAGLGYRDLAVCCEDMEERRNLLGLAMSRFMRAQCYGQLSQQDSHKIIRDDRVYRKCVFHNNTE